MNNKTTKKQYPKKIQAYLNQIATGKVISDKARIVEILSRGPATIETFILRGFKIQTISARLSELEDEGVVYKVSDSNKDYSWYRLIENELEQDVAKKNKANEKKTAWFKRGLALGFITSEQVNTIYPNYTT